MVSVIGRDLPARRVDCRAASGAATQLRVHPPLRLVEGVAEAVIGGRARPADRQAHRDRPGFEPQLADLANALDEVDGLDFVGLGQQDAEAARPEPGDVVGPAGMPADRIGDGRQDPVGRVHAEDRRHAIEPIELDEHDRGRSPVPPDAGPLVGEDQVPFARQEHAGQRVRAAGRGPFGRVDRGRVGPGRGRRAQDIAGRDGPCRRESSLLASTAPPAHDHERDEDHVGRDEDGQQERDVIGHLVRFLMSPAPADSATASGL